MKIYIAGAITNNPNYKEQFANAERRLMKLGYTVVNPVMHEGFSYKFYIDSGLRKLVGCDAIYLLDGWEKSRGAQLEKHYAETVGLKIFGDSYKCKCDGVSLFVDGDGEIDPCIYEDIAIYKNCTVVVSKCTDCGHVEVSWIRQENTETIHESEEL